MSRKLTCEICGIIFDPERRHCPECNRELCPECYEDHDDDSDEAAEIAAENAYEHWKERRYGV